MDFPKKEEFKGLLVRLWFHGLICYLVLWGSSVSNDMLDLMILLPLAHFICNAILVHPIIRACFKTRLNMEKKYRDLKSYQRILSWLYAFLECFLTVLIVIGIYEGVNRMIIAIGKLDKSAVPFPVEPFGYAIIYTLIFYVFYFLKYKFVIRFLQGRDVVHDL